MKNISRVLLFTALKFVEIGAFIFIPYWVGSIDMGWYFETKEGFIYIWAGGLLRICIPSLFIVLFIATGFFQMNWRLVKRLIK